MVHVLGAFGASRPLAIWEAAQKFVPLDSVYFRHDRSQPALSAQRSLAFQRLPLFSNVIALYLELRLTVSESGFNLSHSSTHAFAKHREAKSSASYPRESRCDNGLPCRPLASLPIPLANRETPLDHSILYRGRTLQ
jgi:hypothetical protein